MKSMEQKRSQAKEGREFIYHNEIKQLEKDNKRLQEELSVLKKFQVLLKKAPFGAMKNNTG